MPLSSAALRRYRSPGPSPRTVGFRSKIRSQSAISRWLASSVGFNREALPKASRALRRKRIGTAPAFDEDHCNQVDRHSVTAQNRLDDWPQQIQPCSRKAWASAPWPQLRSINDDKAGTGSRVSFRLPMGAGERLPRGSKN